jgi:hypothetical protein
MMDKYSRPATLEDLKLLLRSLNQHRVDYLLIGGYALAAHGYHRATTDIDLLVPPTAEAGQREPISTASPCGPSVSRACY